MWPEGEHLLEAIFGVDQFLVHDCQYTTLQMTWAPLMWSCRKGTVQHRRTHQPDERNLTLCPVRMQENMAATLAHMSRSVANARLLRRRHSAQVAELLTALSHPRARGTRGQTLMLLLAALTRVLWVAEPDAELWGRLRDLPVCAGLPQFLDVATLDPVTPEVAPPTQQYVVSMQTAAALTIVLVALSSGAAAESVRQPDTMSAALCQVQRWALQTLITERTVDTLNGVVGLLSVCLSDLVPHRRDLPSQIRMLPKVAAILCLGMTAADATDDDYEGQDVRAPFLAALQSVGLLMGGSRPAVAAAA